MVNVTCTSVAGAYEALPACEATKVQTPAVNFTTVVELTPALIVGDT